MSGASRRETSRLEDVAYCLMGIFSVNITTIYGEGGKAFLRLQEEICKESNDNSIFAWQNVECGQDRKVGCGLLAEHPRHFRNSWAVSSEEGGYVLPNRVFIDPTPLAILKKGIQMKSYLLPLQTSRPKIQILVLRCQASAPSHADREYLGILDHERLIPGLGFMYVRLGSDTVTLSKHRPHLTREIMLAKSGFFPDRVYKDLEDLDNCRYEFGSVQPKKTNWSYLNVARVYLSQGSLTSWRVMAWTACYRLNVSMGAAGRKILGRMTFRRDDAKHCMIQLAIRREDRANKFFSGETTTYSGEVSWEQNSGTATWSPAARRTDCGEEHMVHVYCDDPSDILAEDRHVPHLDFTFLIRVRPPSNKVDFS